MATVTVLNELRAYLERHISPTLQLQVPSDDDVLSYELAHPKVFVGWVPPKGLISVGSEFPCMIVGFDQGKHQNGEKNYHIRISAAVYSPGTHEVIDGEMSYTPNYQGYIDLLNLIDRTVNLLINETEIGGLSLDPEIDWNMYQEMPYPYWYGYITLTLRKEMPNKYEKLL